MIAQFKLGLGLDIVNPNSMMDTPGSGLYSPNVLKNDEENWKMFWKGLKSTKYGADNCVIIGVDLTPTDIDHLAGTNQIIFLNSKSLKNVHVLMKDIWCVR